MYLRVFLLLSLTLSTTLTVATDSPATEEPYVYDVIIIGGGIAGLTAAFFLDEYDYLVLEKEQQVGGRALSGNYQGVTYARGAEYLGKPETPLKEIIASLQLTLREVPPPVDVIFHEGHMYSGDYGRARLLINNSSLGEFNRFAQTIIEAYDEYEDIPETNLRNGLGRLDTITAKQWFKENNFSKIYSDIYNVTCRGLFGANIEEISALSFLPEIAYDFEGFEAIEDDEYLEDAFPQQATATGVFSFDGGIAEIPLALGEHLGERLKVETTVTGVKRWQDLFAITCLLPGNQEKTYYADAVILATPSAITQQIARNILSEEQKRLLGSVNYSSYATIALFSDAPIFTEGFDLAVPDGLIFTDMYDATWIARHYNPSQQKSKIWITSLYVAPFSYRDHSLATMPDEQLVNVVLAQLDQLLPGAAQHITGHDITRFQYSYPIMTPGSYQRMTRLVETTEDGFYFAGDYTIYPTFEAAALSGLNAAEKVMEWLEDED